MIKVFSEVYFSRKLLWPQIEENDSRNPGKRRVQWFLSWAANDIISVFAVLFIVKNSEVAKYCQA